MEKNLWEILVPASNKKERFSYEHHKVWDAKVNEIAGGVTILRSAKGEWVSPTGKLYKDRIIPVRIVCTQDEIEQIINITLKHYNQEAVMAYRLGDKVITKFKNNI